MSKRKPAESSMAALDEQIGLLGSDGFDVTVTIVDRADVTSWVVLATSRSTLSDPESDIVPALSRSDQSAPKRRCPDPAHKSGPNDEDLPTGTHWVTCPTCGLRLRFDVINPTR